MTVAGDLVYALNAGDADTLDIVAGFRVNANGGLVPLRDSIRRLSGRSLGPAQIEFGLDGRVLVVTKKATNSIDTYLCREQRADHRPPTCTPRPERRPSASSSTDAGT